MASSRPFLPSSEADFVLVGGGLQNSLIALAVLERHPEASVVLVEAGAAVGGNHTWCFHAGDVPPRGEALVEELVVKRWPGYDVMFPGESRALGEPYAAMTSERLREVVEERFRVAPNAFLLTDSAATRVGASAVTLADGTIIRGRAVIDARGPSEHEVTERVGYQKFVGYELALSAPMERAVPLLMDARVPQTDGLRFFYVLPLAPDRVLVEDTYFSDSPELDENDIRDEIARYADRSGLQVERVLRREKGVLPLPLRAPLPRTRRPDEAFVAGYAGGFFHPATGYSFPVALRLALRLAAHVDDPFGAELDALVRDHGRQFRFGAFLNRLLFTGFEPEDRWNAFARFYRLPESVIRRFYALETTAGDRARILCGRPPRGVSVLNLLAGGAPG